MKVLYTGNYREKAVFYRGVVFVEGEASDVVDDWYETNKTPNLHPVNDVSSPAGIDEKDELITQAESLGVKVDKRWGVDKLKAVINGNGSEHS